MRSPGFRVMPWEAQWISCCMLKISSEVLPSCSSFGYAVGIDMSMRDWQNPDEKTARQYGKYWIWGKSMDAAAPVGPYIVTRD